MICGFNRDCNRRTDFSGHRYSGKRSFRDIPVFCSQFCVKYTSSIGNVISYTLNDEPLDICLRGKTHLAEATNVLSVIENLQEALASEDRTTVLAIFEEVGYLNALDIIRICYPKLAICFFTRIAERMVHTRQRVYPFLLLKNYIKTVSSKRWFRKVTR